MGTIPMITDGQFKILGGQNSFILYLCSNYSKADEALNHGDHKKSIDKHLSWFTNRMRPNTSRIIRMIVQPQAFGDKQPQPDDIRKEEDEFFKKLLPSLEKQLDGRKYFCCEDFTIADIQYYCEISTIVALTRKDISEVDFPHLYNWYHSMAEVSELVDLDKKLAAVILKYNFN